jgi:hypothetical protein
MFSSIQTWTIIGFTAAVWLVLSYAGVVRGQPGAIVDVSKVMPAVLVGIALYERWGWRLPFLHPHVVGQPIILGTWRGDLESLWPDPARGGQHPPIKTAYLTIRQTLTTVEVRLLSDESASDQMAGAVKRLPNRIWVVSYTYANTPDIDRRKGSPPHLGGALLKIFGDPADRLEGEYWTDRDSKGKLTMTAHVSSIAQSYREAEALFAEPG